MKELYGLMPLINFSGWAQPMLQFPGMLLSHHLARTEATRDCRDTARSACAGSTPHPPPHLCLIIISCAHPRARERDSQKHKDASNSCGVACTRRQRRARERCGSGAVRNGTWAALTLVGQIGPWMGQQGATTSKRGEGQNRSPPDPAGAPVFVVPEHLHVDAGRQSVGAVISERLGGDAGSSGREEEHRPSKVHHHNVLRTEEAKIVQPTSVKRQRDFVPAAGQPARNLRDN